MHHHTGRGRDFERRLRRHRRSPAPGSVHRRPRAGGTAGAELTRSARGDRHVPPRRLISVIHVGNHQPSSVAALVKSQREFPNVRLSLLARESTDDVSHHAFHRKCEGAQHQRTTLALVALLDRGTTPDRWSAAGEHEAIVIEKAGKRGSITSPPGSLIIG